MSLLLVAAVVYASSAPLPPDPVDDGAVPSISPAPSSAPLPDRRPSTESLATAGMAGCATGGIGSAAVALTGIGLYCVSFDPCETNPGMTLGAALATGGTVAMAPASAGGALLFMLVEALATGKPVARLITGALPGLALSALAATAMVFACAPQTFTGLLYVERDHPAIAAVALVAQIAAFAAGPLTVLGARAATSEEPDELAMMRF